MEPAVYLCYTSIDCYHDNGATYRGEVSRTELGTKCIAWTDASNLNVNPTTHPDAVSCPPS